jgi:Tol biopolymer transport system component
MRIGIVLLSFLVFFSELPMLQAQYFGRNKPRYANFDFQLLKTPNFDIYHYLNDEELLNDLANQSELWYESHQRILRDTIRASNPLIFYNDHSEFQQTNAIGAHIGVGTGGVTEALRNRVIMPLTLSNQKSFQILGHELVHAFQFNMILRNEEMSRENLRNIPLFLIEGKAEYLSRGRDDPFTAMWMRDAVIQDDVPSIRDMNKPQYFPYRFGHAFWAHLTGTYGDAVIPPLFNAVAIHGMNRAFPRVVGKSMEEVSSEWKNELKAYYNEQMADIDFQTIGRKVISDETAGRMNVSPALSPNGRYVVFLSEKDLFTADLFLANANTGEIIRKIASSVRYSDIDHMDVIESAGTWSPDNRTFAYVGFRQGRNVLITVDIESGRRQDIYEIPELAFFSNPTWAPTGNVVALSGLKEGRPDLFIYNMDNRRLRNLTNDNHSYLLASWSHDAEKLVATTDRVSRAEGMKAGKWTHNLAVYSFAENQWTDLDLFPGADNFNPVFDAENRIWFLSDRDGYRDIYLYDQATDSLFQQTRIATGVSGITTYAPALTLARRVDRVMYNVFEGGNYQLYNARTEAFLREAVEKDDVDQSGAGQLPPVGRLATSLSDGGLSRIVIDDFPDTLNYEKAPFDSRFSLVAASQSMGVGVGVSSGAFGSGAMMGGGVQLLFSDILGDHQLYTTLFLNGEIYDVGLMGTYINRENRIAWGASLSHIPYRTGFSMFGFEEFPGTDIIVPVIRTDILRIFEQRAQVFAHYPFNIRTRVEASMGTSYRFFRLDRYTDFYDETGRFFIGRDRQRIRLESDDIVVGGTEIRKAFTHNVGTALVGDNSYFGLTAPMQGYRYRLSYDRFFGGYSFNAAVIDGRRYFRVAPVTLAVRGFHYSRFGTDANVYFPIFVGQMGMVRGYELSGRDFQEDYDLRVSQVVGSKVLLGSAEVRLPFTGPERLAVIRSGFLASDLNAFFDVGVAFNDYDNITFGSGRGGESVVLMSAGLSLRINLFGAMVLEPYYAFPLRSGGEPRFGLNFIPGW